MIKRSSIIFLSILLAMSVFMSCASQEIKVPDGEWSEDISISGLFGENMVLQRDAKVNIWGWGTPGKYLRVDLGNTPKILKVDENGKWEAVFKTGKAGESVDLMLSAEDTLLIEDIVYGDVWLCAGQSNMEMPLAGWGRVLNYQQEIDAADYDDIRLFKSYNSQIQYSYEAEEKVRTKNGWEVCSPESVEEFSATAYFFARKVYKETGVPIGLIQATSGGTPIEAWMPRELCEKYDDIYSRMDDVLAGDKEKDKVREKESKSASSDWYDGTKEFDKGLNAEIPWYAEDYDDSDWTIIPDVPDGFWDENGFEETKGVFWYRKKVDLPENTAKKINIISLGQIYERNELYINGTYIGEFTSNARPSQYLIRGILKPGQNQIAVRIQANRTNGGMRGLPEDFFIEVDWKKIPLTGEWRIAKSFDYKDYKKAPKKLSLKRRPSIVYNALINPLIPFTIKGMLWYQGESNMNNSEVYGEYFKAMIDEYRDRWNKDFPFYFVQIANYMKNYSSAKLPYLREAQTEALELKDVHMISAIDLGTKHDVHPKNKQDVGLRLANLALLNEYGQKVSAEHPEILSNKIKIEQGLSNKKEIVLRVKRSGELRLISGDKISGFEICDESGEWLRAEAKIEDEKIIVSHPDIEKPIHVRHAFCNDPVINITDDSGLPLLPFRSDKFERVIN